MKKLNVCINDCVANFGSYKIKNGDAEMSFFILNILQKFGIDMLCNLKYMRISENSAVKIDA